MIVDSRADANKLHIFVLVHDGWENVCNEVDALL